MSDLAALAARTREVYVRNAGLFDVQRSRILFERVWLDRFAARLPVGGRVLDAGCGAGEPIARDLLDRGFAVTGVDFSPPMLELCRARLPAARWIGADMRTLALGEMFDGIIAWHSFFHLRPPEQRTTLGRFAAHLEPGGVLMTTVGPDASEAVGQVGADPVYHASLSPAGYRAALAEAGLSLVTLVPEDPECDYSSILLAEKPPGPSGA
jgi:SAM-dependent methyltransferase